MRKLVTRDAFKLMQILRAAGMKDELAEIINMASVKTGRNQEEIGAKVFGAVFDLLGNGVTEAGMCSLLADVSEKTAEEIQNQPVGETVQLIKDILTENNITDFFGQAAPTT